MLLYQFVRGACREALLAPKGRLHSLYRSSQLLAGEPEGGQEGLERMSALSCDYKALDTQDKVKHAGHLIQIACYLQGLGRNRGVSELKNVFAKTQQDEHTHQRSTQACTHTHAASILAREQANTRALTPARVRARPQAHTHVRLHAYRPVYMQAYSQNTFAHMFTQSLCLSLPLLQKTRAHTHRY